MANRNVGIMCTECRSNLAQMEKDGVRLCFSCLGKRTGINLENVSANLPIISKVEKNDISDFKPNLHLIDSKGKPVDEVEDREYASSGVVNANLIFVDAKGNQRMVRITEAEQRSIANKIIERRKKHNQEIEYADVCVLPSFIADRVGILLDGLCKHQKDDKVLPSVLDLAHDIMKAIGNNPEA